MTQMERSEGDPLSMDVSALSFEDADGKSMRFQVDSKGMQEAPPVAGTATREADDDMRVELTKPAPKAIDFGHNVLFPTQHIERLIEAAKHGGGAIQARVYDGSDTGAKIYATMAVVGKEASKPSERRRLRGRTERGPPLAGGRFLFRRILQGFLARIHPVLRSLRKRRVRQPQARLRDLRVAGAPSETRDPAGRGLREIGRRCEGPVRARPTAAALRAAPARERSPRDAKPASAANLTSSGSSATKYPRTLP